MTKIQETSVLVVGAGGCGLTSSLFLSGHGVDHIVIEKHKQPSPMPKARALNRRTMEIFRQHGVADQIYERAIPGQYIWKMRWATSLGGDLSTDKRTLFEMATVRNPQVSASLSAGPGALFPQVRLEPLLRQEVDRRSHSSLVFDTELVGIEQDADGVTSTVRNRASGETWQIRSQYVIAADAGKTISPLVGATSSGTPDLANMVTLYFKADLSEHIDTDEVMTIWFANPQGDPSSWGSGVLGKLGPTKFGRDSEEWMFHFNFSPEDDGPETQEALLEKIRNLLKLPELQMEVLGTSRWIVKGMLADRYRFGRIFLAGDAAHRHTPTTGLGLNSAVHDAHNLAWKIAMVLAGEAEPSLLDTYESERRPVAKRNVDWALFTFSNHPLTGAAIGIVPGDRARSEANFNALLAEGFDGEARRARFRDTMEMHRTEFQAADLDLGIRYDEGALVADGTPAPDLDPLGRTYHAIARPGHRFPHAWLSHNGKEVSSHDVAKPNAFTLFVSGEATPWQAAVAQYANRKFPIQIVSLQDAGEIVDAGGAFRQQCELEPGGAVLVRPDLHVAWRTASLPVDPAGALDHVMKTLASPKVDLSAQRKTIKPALSY